jgi:purine-nucleoside phosphorylase
MRIGLRAMPIHLTGNPGDYADGCLLPGDPLRAKYIAETFFDDPVEVNSERGMLGYTGTFQGKRVSVQSSGMGCPSAGIVIEELVQLGVNKILRVGTCGGLQPNMEMGELIVAISATPADATPTHLIGGEPHAPTADWELVHAAVHHAKALDKKIRVGGVVSSDVFYNPDGGQYQRWSDRGILAVEMEAAMLFTLGALKKIQAGCLLIVSDVVVEGEFKRITDEEMRAAVDQMTELALVTLTDSH